VKIKNLTIGNFYIYLLIVGIIIASTWAGASEYFNIKGDIQSQGELILKQGARMEYWIAQDQLESVKRRIYELEWNYLNDEGNFVEGVPMTPKDRKRYLNDQETRDRLIKKIDIMESPEPKPIK
jgi:hypothetical protein